MRVALKSFGWCTAIVLVIVVIWAAYDFYKFVRSHRWFDEYPNRTQLISEAVRSRGPGAYDLFTLYPNSIAVCVVFGGMDPRQFAANALNKDLIRLQGDQSFFTQEHTTAVMFFDKEDNFKIDEIDSNDIFFERGPIAKNTCIDRPSIARITVERKTNQFSSAKLSAIIDIK